MPNIPTNVLLPVSTLVVILIAYFIEVIAYYGFFGWYYRSGPALLKERWQTSGSVEQIQSAIRSHLRADGLVGRETDLGFCFRQTTISINAWPRVLLRIEEAERGAALHFEVRPFYGMWLLIFPIAWLIAGAFGANALTLYVMIGALIVVYAIYRWIMPWDVRRINRLRTVREALSPFGLRICENCGYDLFGHKDPSRCPECGKT